MAEKLVIIGGSHAAAALCSSLVADAYQGHITLVSADRHLPYHRPPLSKAYLKEIAKGETPEPPYLKAESFYKDAGITTQLETTITEIDRQNRQVVDASGNACRYDKLVIATGASARHLPMQGADGANVHTVRAIEDAQALGARIDGAKNAVVIGGGFIGLETGASLMQLGLNVTLIEGAERLMGRSVAPEISEFVTHHLRRTGMDILLSTPVDELVSDGKIVTAVKAGGKTHSTDLLIIGIGAVPNVALAEQAGLACRNGILVDEYLTTGDPHILSIGDCAAFPTADGDHHRLEAVSNANDHARAASKVLTGKGEPFHAHPWFWSDQADLALQMAGLSHGADHRVQRGTASADGFSVFHFAGEHLMAVDSVNRPSDHVFARKALEMGLQVTPEMAADENVDLRAMLKTAMKAAKNADG